MPANPYGAMAPDIMEYRGGRVVSRRKYKDKDPRPRDAQTEKDRKEAAAFATNPTVVFKQLPEERLQWLLQALLHLGKKTLKAGDLYAIVVNESFVAGVPPNVGAQMRATVLANLHVFTSKQQKSLESEANSSKGLGKFATVAKDKRKTSYGADAEKKKRRRHSSSDSSTDRDKRSRREDSPIESPEYLERRVDRDRFKESDRPDERTVLDERKTSDVRDRFKESDRPDERPVYDERKTSDGVRDRFKESDRPEKRTVKDERKTSDSVRDRLNFLYDEEKTSDGVDADKKKRRIMRSCREDTPLESPDNLDGLARRDRFEEGDRPDERNLYDDRKTLDGADAEKKKRRKKTPENLDGRANHDRLEDRDLREFRNKYDDCGRQDDCDRREDRDRSQRGDEFRDHSFRSRSPVRLYANAAGDRGDRRTGYDSNDNFCDDQRARGHGGSSRDHQNYRDAARRDDYRDKADGYHDDGGYRDSGGYRDDGGYRDAPRRDDYSDKADYRGKGRGSDYNSREGISDSQRGRGSGGSFRDHDNYRDSGRGDGYRDNGDYRDAPRRDDYWEETDYRKTERGSRYREDAHPGAAPVGASRSSSHREDYRADYRGRGANYGHNW